MSPQEAKVFIIEDNDIHRSDLKEWLERAGHSVVGTAKTFKDAQDAVKRLQELRAEIVTLDANLSPGKADGREGEVLAQQIRREAPDITIIGMSVFKGGTRGVHLDVGKSAGLREINRVITKLPRKSK